MYIFKIFMRIGSLSSTWNVHRSDNMSLKSFSAEECALYLIHINFIVGKLTMITDLLLFHL